MKKLLLLPFIVAAMVFAPLAISNAQTSEQQECPEGSYNIGTSEEPICKNEPTGCQYGDAIPMDVCHKYAPVGQTLPVSVVEEDPAQQFVGK